MYEQNIALSANICDVCKSDDNTRETSEFHGKFTRVTCDLESAKSSLVSRAQRWREIVQFDAEARKMLNGFSTWFKMMGNEVQEIISRPMKLHASPARIDVSELEVILNVYS